ncbi:MAG: ZIP family metal transporter [Nitrososphaerota archaeon]|nr:ZIP family metal transporter [Nitrososphaerota archaeon]
MVSLFFGLVGNLVLLGFLGGCFTAALNAVGVTPVLLLSKVSQKVQDVGLSFGAGVMMAAAFTSLIIPGFEEYGVSGVLVGIILGSLVIAFADRLLPQMHFIIGREGLKTDRISGIWLFVLAITLHNIPEGLAVGVGFGSGEMLRGLSLMTAIGLQNIPEGLAVAFSLLATGKYTRRQSYFAGVVSGLVEPPMALLGAWAVIISHLILPYAMGFAGGAMIFVVSDEIIPETHRRGRERLSSLALIAGLITMLALDALL